MQMTGYTKLFGSIVASTIWREPHTVRIVWITMLAMANKSGIVEASLPGLADLSRVTLAECKEALAHLESADEYSRTPDNEGRRITPVDGGWLILNHAKYRAKMGLDEKRAYFREKKREQRQLSKSVSNNVKDSPEMSSMSIHAEAQSETKTEEDTNTGDLVSVSPKVWTPNEEQRRLNAIFNRREATRWSKQEIAVWRILTPIPEEDFLHIEKYYKAKLPSNGDYRRRDLSTLLNNWNGEVDRARQFKAPSCF
jgi:sRNA-binding protein